MRDGTNETLLHITEMNVQITAPRWSPGFGHVLRKDLARLDSTDEHRTQIANDRRQEILRLQRVSRAHRGSFLAQRAKHAADNFRLAIEIDQALFEQPRQLQVAIKLEHLFRLQRRFRCAGERLSLSSAARRILGKDPNLASRRTPPAMWSWLNLLV